MNTKRFLIMITIVILLSVPIPAFAQEKPFKGLASMAADGLWIAGTNLDVAAVAVVAKPVETVGGGIEYLSIATDAVVGTARMLTKMTADGLWAAGTNLPTAAKAVVTDPVGTVFGGVDLILRGADGILKIAFGP